MIRMFWRLYKTGFFSLHCWPLLMLEGSYDGKSICSPFKSEEKSILDRLGPLHLVKSRERS